MVSEQLPPLMDRVCSLIFHFFFKKKFLETFNLVVVHLCSCLLWAHQVRSILRKSYFHGDISTRDAEGHLAGKQVGTFLVRFSTSSPGFFTISKVAIDNSIQHQRIIHHPNQPAFYINNRVCCNKTKQNKTKQNKTKQNKTKQNIHTSYLASTFDINCCFCFILKQMKAYASLEDLINQNARELNLISPCLGSRFSSLFVEQSISGYVQ